VVATKNATGKFNVANRAKAYLIAHIVSGSGIIKLIYIRTFCDSGRNISIGDYLISPSNVG
jgi:hypothetical protein